MSQASVENRVFSVELSDSDLPVAHTPAWHQYTLEEKSAILAASADLLVVNYLRDAELISLDYAGVRTHQIKETLSGRLKH